MSAFIMNAEPIAKIATYTAALLNMGYNFFGMSAPESLHHALSGCRDKYGYYSDELIYNALYQLNIDAVNGRYHENYTLDSMEKYKPVTAYKKPEYTSTYNPETRRYNGGHYQIDKWMLEMSNRLACFCYQCDEDATYKSDLFLAMRDLERCLNTFIVHNMNAWNNHKWGE
jgi:hypothetical protein